MQNISFFYSVKIEPLFPLDYHIQNLNQNIEIKNNIDEFTVRIRVKNVGSFEGKEVIKYIYFLIKIIKANHINHQFLSKKLVY